MFRGISGGGFIVHDLELSKQFYADNFGCVVTRQSEPGSGKALDDLTGFKDVAVLQCWMSQSGNEGFSLHLIEVQKPKGRAGTEPNDAGTGFLGFASEDLEEDCAKMIANGGRLAGKVADFGNGRKLAWGLDPNGVIMRLSQEGEVVRPRS